MIPDEARPVRRLVQGRYAGVPCVRQASGRAGTLHAAGGTRAVGLEVDIRGWRRRAREIRVRDETGAFRLIHVAKFADAICVLHAFQKKVQKTSQMDIDLPERRHRELRHWRRKQVMAKMSEPSGNIFLDLGFPSDEAAVLLRAKSADAPRRCMKSEGITQTQATKRLGITQPASPRSCAEKSG